MEAIYRNFYPAIPEKCVLRKVFGPYSGPYLVKNKINFKETTFLKFLLSKYNGRSISKKIKDIFHQSEVLKSREACPFSKKVLKIPYNSGKPQNFLNPYK